VIIPVSKRNEHKVLINLQNLFEGLCYYLLSVGWKRDGDDAGLWIPPEGATTYQEVDFWTALEIQFDKEGINLETGPVGPNHG
jgi:hypothetical protein